MLLLAAPPCSYLQHVVDRELWDPSGCDTVPTHRMCSPLQLLQASNPPALQLQDQPRPWGCAPLKRTSFRPRRDMAQTFRRSFSDGQRERLGRHARLSLW